jgi:hypothetical protein
MHGVLRTESARSRALTLTALPHLALPTADLLLSVAIVAVSVTIADVVDIGPIQEGWDGGSQGAGSTDASRGDPAQ